MEEGKYERKHVKLYGKFILYSLYPYLLVYLSFSSELRTLEEHERANVTIEIMLKKLHPIHQWIFRHFFYVYLAKYILENFVQITYGWISGQDYLETTCCLQEMQLIDI